MSNMPVSAMHPILREAATMSWMSEQNRYKPASFRRVDDRVIEESDMLVHEFVVDNSESNPMFITDSNLRAWLKTDPGQWIQEHSVEEPYIVWYENAIYGGYTYRMMARLHKQDQTFFKMKFK